MSNQRILIVGDSRIARLQKSPSASFPLHNVDTVIENGIGIFDLIDRVNDQLRPEHAVLIIVAFLGDCTCVVKHPISENAFASLVKCNADQPATRVLELASVAHTKWQALRKDRQILWTLPYYLDLVTYNTYRLRSPLPEDIFEISLEASQRFVHFVDQMKSKWKHLMPANAMYRHLNETLFHGNGVKHLDNFRCLSKHFTFPMGYLSDGLHPTPFLCGRIWAFLSRALNSLPAVQPRLIISAPSTSAAAADLSPLVAKLSLKDRLKWTSSSTLSDDSGSYQKKWKGKGRGKGRGRTPTSHPYAYQAPVPSPANSNLPYWNAPPPSMQGFYAGGPPACIAPAPSLPYGGTSQDPVEEQSTDRYGNITWRNLPPTAAGPLGSVNFSIPHQWSWSAHLKEVERVNGQCATPSEVHQVLFRTQAANLIRERALEEMRTGLISTFNSAATTLGHRTTYGFSYPVQKFAQVETDLREILPPIMCPPPQVPSASNASYYYPAPDPNYYYPPAP